MYSKTKLERVLELHRGYDLPEHERKEGNVPIISSSGYSGLHNDYKCDGENVITGRYGTIGEVFYHEGKCWPLNTALYVSDFKGNNPKYVYYLLKYILKMSIDGKDKSTVPGVDRNVLHQMKIPFCQDIKEQKELITILEKIDRRIDINRKINDNLQQQLQLLYNYWFKQYDFPDENGNPYRSSGGAMTWNEHLKQNMPLNWKEAQLKDIFDVSGKAISREECQTDAYYTPIDVIPKRTITFAGGLPAAEANSSLQLYEENDVLLGAMRVYFHRVCISAQSGITRTTTLVLRSKQAEYLGYAYQVLNDDNAILYATQHSSGTQQPYVNWNDALENYRFAMPSNPKLLYEYSKISEPLIVKAKNCARETEQLTKLRDWLLPMLMNGQTTISD